MVSGVRLRYEETEYRIEHLHELIDELETTIANGPKGKMDEEYAQLVVYLKELNKKEKLLVKLRGFLNKGA